MLEADGTREYHVNVGTAACFMTMALSTLSMLGAADDPEMRLWRAASLSMKTNTRLWMRCSSHATLATCESGNLGCCSLAIRHSWVEVANSHRSILWCL